MLINKWLGGLFLFIVMSMPVSAELRLEGAFVRGLPPTQTVTAAFLNVVNDSSSPVVITGAASDIAERVEIHKHSHSNGMMRMEQVPNVEVPANGRFVFKPMGYHLMLFGLKRPLVDGELVRLELFGADGQSVQQQVPVRSVLNE